MELFKRILHNKKFQITINWNGKSYTFKRKTKHRFSFTTCRCCLDTRVKIFSQYLVVTLIAYGDVHLLHSRENAIFRPSSFSLVHFDPLNEYNKLKILMKPLCKIGIQSLRIELVWSWPDTKFDRHSERRYLHLNVNSLEIFCERPQYH